MARSQFTFTFRNAEPGAQVTFSAAVYASKTAQVAEGPTLVLDSTQTIAVWTDATELTATWVDGTGTSIAAEASLAIPVVVQTGGTLGTGPDQADAASIAAKAQKLTRTTVKTGNYTAAAGDMVPCDTTSAAFTVTLPNAPAVGSRVVVKIVTLGAGHFVTIACAGSDVFNKTAGGTTASLQLLGHAMNLQYDTGGIWTVVADDVPLSQLNGSFVQVLGPSNGTDDTTAVNALLAAGGRYRGTAGQTYKISTPLVLPSNTELDMTGCTVQEIAGSQNNMVVNYGYANPAGTASDGAITSGSNVLTSALGASAVVGQTVTVAGATSGGYQALCGLVSAVTSTTITLTDLLGNALNAGATVSGATVTLYTRDTNVRLIGGTWDRQNNTGNLSGTGTRSHSLFFRHVDGLTLTGQQFKSAAGKYCFSLASVTNFVVERPTFLSTFSDGVHVDGPAFAGVIRDVFGAAGDDFVALTAEDWHQYGDVCGDITDVDISNIYPKASTRAAVKVLGGPGGACKHIRIRHVGGSVLGTGGAVWIGDDNGQPETVGGVIDQITVEHLATAVPNNMPLVQLNGIAMQRLRFSGVTFNNANSNAGWITIAPATASTIASLILDNIYVLAIADNSDLFVTNVNSTISRLVLSNWDVSTTALHNPTHLLGTVTDLAVTGYRGNYRPPASGGSGLVYLNDTSASATVNRVSLTDIRLTGNNSGQLVRANQSTHTLGEVVMTDVVATAVAWLADLGPTVDMILNGVANPSPGQGIMNVRATGVVTVRGDGNNLTAGTNNWNVASGGKCSVRCLDVPPSTHAGGFPTIAAGAGLGTGPTVAVAGSDRAGTVTLTPGTTPAAGAQATVTFAGTWAQSPKVALTPTNAAAQAAGGYISAKSTTTFAVSSANTPGGAMTFDYVIAA